MAEKSFNLSVDKDHIKSLTRVTGQSGLMELIWNSLDADASEISIEMERTDLGGYSRVCIKDNGHGLEYEQGRQLFTKIGGSLKPGKSVSPGGREYHGKFGRGRYKSLALGSLVKFTSRSINGKKLEEYSITIDQNNLETVKFTDREKVDEPLDNHGFEVEIVNLHEGAVKEVFSSEGKEALATKLAVYFISNPNFKIKIQGQELSFEKFKVGEDNKEFYVNHDGLDYKFEVKIIEWRGIEKRKMFICTDAGLPWQETNLGVRHYNVNVSCFLKSLYINGLKASNPLKWEDDKTLSKAISIAKERVRRYISKKIHKHSHEVINDLKQAGIYPYKEDAKDEVEETKRRVFDIVTLQVNDFYPAFSDQDEQSKALTLQLISTALETNSHGLRRIFTEVLELPEEKRMELISLLDQTSLEKIIDAAAEVKNRLQFLNFLEQVIYDPALQDGFKERKHLQKILEKETWIFGDQYTYGANDQSLKNVLLAHINHLGRKDLIESFENEPVDTSMGRIPDICLFQQYSLGSYGHENLIVEIKKPGIDAGFEQALQIERYATTVAQDGRFAADKTRWKFYLITGDIKIELVPKTRQKHQKPGLILSTDNCDVYVLKWGDIIHEAKLRLEYLREKLNLSIRNNSEGIDYVKQKYDEYLPVNFGEDTSNPDMEGQDEEQTVDKKG